VVFIGALIVIALFVVYGWARDAGCGGAPDGFGAAGAGNNRDGLVAMALINLRSVLVRVPTKGIPLPCIIGGRVCCQLLPPVWRS